MRVWFTYPGSDKPTEAHDVTLKESDWGKEIEGLWRAVRDANSNEPWFSPYGAARFSIVVDAGPVPLPRGYRAPAIWERGFQVWSYQFHRPNGSDRHHCNSSYDGPSRPGTIHDWVQWSEEDVLSVLYTWEGPRGSLIVP